MTELSLQERLLRWLKAHPGFHASGDLQRLVMQHTTYTAQNVGRRLRELENEGKIEVRYEKSHAHYRAIAKPPSLEVWFEQLSSDH